MEERRAQRRTFLTCQICYRPYQQLTTHLKRNCMKHRSPEERRAVVKHAKEVLMRIGSKGTTICVNRMPTPQNPTSFLEERGFHVIDGPDRSVDWDSQPDALPDAQANASDGVPAEHENQMQLNVPEEGEMAVGEEQRVEISIHPKAYTPCVRWKKSVRKLMMEAKMYKRHSSNQDVLKGFATYLKKFLGVRNFRQEVDNVARFLFYMNPKAVNVNFVTDIGRIRSYFVKLAELKVSCQTRLNYLKHIQRFVRYQMNTRDTSDLDPTLRLSCQHFMSAMGDLRHVLTKGVAEEIVLRRFNGLSDTIKTPKQCWRILEEAKRCFLDSIRDAQDECLNIDRRVEMIYYLEAILILKHLQRPGVVQNFTVSEWEQRIPHTYQGEEMKIVGVKSHKTSTRQVATFVLNGEEEKYFQVYYDKVRPIHVHPARPLDNFFLSTSGNPIHSVSGDIRRFHHKYGLPIISSQTARRVFETWTVGKYSDPEKHLFAHYLAHSNRVAQRVYREKVLDDICHGYKLVITAGEAAMLTSGEIYSQPLEGAANLKDGYADETDEDIPSGQGDTVM